MLILLVITAVALIRLRALFGMVMVTGIYSLLSASFFVVEDAVDVAFTEASVGAGLTTVLFLSTLALVGHEQKPQRVSPLALAVVCVAGALLVYSTRDMPRYADPAAPIHHHVVPRYIQDSAAEVGPPNIVTSVLASYRGYDTLGETGVVFTAAIGVLLLLGTARKPRAGQQVPSASPSVVAGAKGNTILRHRLSPLRENPILREVSDLMIAPILLFALYVQWHGDYGPGGGFQAGVIFAVGVIIYALIHGIDKAQRYVPPRVVRKLIAIGWMLYIGTGIVALLLGAPFLDYGALAHGSHGQHYGILAVELGVGIAVASVMITIFYAFAGRGRA
ncbi:MAG: DUF4040 domain-containing protein [Nitrospirota bacterium]